MTTKEPDGPKLRLMAMMDTTNLDGLHKLEKMLASEVVERLIRSLTQVELHALRAEVQRRIDESQAQ